MIEAHVPASSVPAVDYGNKCYAAKLYASAKEKNRLETRTAILPVIITALGSVP
jgi:hypothetical protein